MFLSVITKAQTISGGGGHSFALCNDSTARAWGYNDDGALGSLSFSSNVPVPVVNLTGIISISGGRNHTLALKNDGTVWAWGINNCGQLGNANDGLHCRYGLASSTNRR